MRSFIKENEMGKILTKRGFDTTSGHEKLIDSRTLSRFSIGSGYDVHVGDKAEGLEFYVNKEYIILEKCNTYDEETEKECVSVREIRYLSDKEELSEALRDFEENFDLNKVVKTEDFFPGECLSSEIICIFEADSEVIVKTISRQFLISNT